MRISDWSSDVCSSDLPSRLGMVLDMTLRDIERVLYFEAWCVIEPGMTPLKRGQIMSDDDFLAKTEAYGADLQALMGAEAVREPFRTIGIDRDVSTLRAELKASKSYKTAEHSDGEAGDKT